MQETPPSRRPFCVGPLFDEVDKEIETTGCRRGHGFLDGGVAPVVPAVNVHTTGIEEGIHLFPIALGDGLVEGALGWFLESLGRRDSGLKIGGRTGEEKKEDTKNGGYPKHRASIS